MTEWKVLPPYATYGGKPVRGQALDLSEDNELPALLDEREALRNRMAADRRRLKKINRQLETKLGDAPRGILPGWSLFWVTRERAGYEVEDLTYRFLWVERTPEDE